MPLICQHYPTISSLTIASFTGGDQHLGGASPAEQGSRRWCRGRSARLQRTHTPHVHTHTHTHTRVHHLWPNAPQLTLECYYQDTTGRLKKGDVVLSYSGWQTHAVVPAASCRKIDWDPKVSLHRTYTHTHTQRVVLLALNSQLRVRLGAWSGGAVLLRVGRAGHARPHGLLRALRGGQAQGGRDRGGVGRRRRCRLHRRPGTHHTHTHRLQSVDPDLLVLVLFGYHQLAKIRGCRVVAIAGSDDKLRVCGSLSMDCVRVRWRVCVCGGLTREGSGA